MSIMLRRFSYCIIKKQINELFQQSVTMTLHDTILIASELEPYRIFEYQVIYHLTQSCQIVTHPGGTEDLPVGFETCQILASRKGCKTFMKECLVIPHLPRLPEACNVLFLKDLTPQPAYSQGRKARVLSLHTFPGYYGVRRLVPLQHIGTNIPRPGGEALRCEVATLTSSPPLFSLIMSFPYCTPLPHPFIIQRALIALISQYH